MKTQLVIHSVTKTRMVDVQFSEFPDRDSYCLIEDMAGIKDGDIIVRHELYPDQNDRIVQLLILIDLLYELGARSVSVFVPYLPYARQDKRHLAGEAVSAHTLSKTLQRARVDALYTFDCHFMKGIPLVNHEGLEIHNISLGPYLLRHLDTLLPDTEYEVIGPDEGSSYLVKDYGGKNMQKERMGYDSGTQVRHRSVKKLKHDHLELESKTIVIIDDMISTGGTLLKAVDILQKRGAKEVYCLAVHGLFLNGCYEKLMHQTSAIVVSDTISQGCSIPIVEMAWRDQVEPLWTARFQ